MAPISNTNTTKLIFVLLFNIFITSIYAQFAGGNGTQNDPYLIQTAAQLDSVRNYLSCSFRQIADIDLAVEPYNTGAGWQEIGNGETPFQGRYNGSGYSIANLHIYGEAFYKGLFGFTSNATIDSVRLEDFYIQGGTYIGGLVANATNTDISYCTVTGYISGGTVLGGLVGYLINSSSLILCSSSGSIYGYNTMGGLVGECAGSCSISRCYSSTSVNWGSTMGGLFGIISGSLLTNSYSWGSVSGEHDLGGIACTASNNVITNCYSRSNVSCWETGTGGLICNGSQNTITNSYWDTEVSGQDTSEGGEGRTSEEMTWPYAANTYVDWDFDNIWQADENSTVNFGYPYLRVNQIINVLPSPIMTPSTGPYYSDISVTISCAAENASIYYTLNGDIPNEQSILYTGPINVSSSLTIKAIAYLDGYLPSNVSTGVYTMLVSHPIISPDAGVYYEPVLVTIMTTTSGTQIFYTTDGTDPTEESILYTESLTLNTSTLLKARAYREGWSPSQIVTSVYTITVANDDNIIPSAVLSCYASPNPFSDIADIKFSLPKDNKINLSIFNSKGQLVRTLTDSQFSKEEHTLTWDGKTDTGQQVANGIYLYRLQGTDFSITKKLLLTK